MSQPVPSARIQQAHYNKLKTPANLTDYEASM